jgi:ArsR family transcriptional regulator
MPLYDYIFILTLLINVNIVLEMVKNSRTPLILSDEALRLVASRFRVLGDPNRLRILNTLMQAEHGVGALVEATGLEQSNLSRHLAVLRREGLVERESDGNRAVYRIDAPSIVQLCEIVCGEIVGQLSETLDAFPEVRDFAGTGI